MATANDGGGSTGLMVDLTGFQRDVLTVISDFGNPYGLKIKRELEADYGEVNHGRLYPNLDQLAEAGLVEKAELDKRTNTYSLTDEGRRVLSADLERRQEAISA